MTGIATVAALEFRIRLRTGRWRWLLVIWFLLLTGMAALIRATIEGEQLFGEGDYTGAIMFGGLMLVVLGLALLIAPALSAQSVNGDRERGVLAPLQITGLTPWEITLGKLVASWATALVFLLVTGPLALWCLTEGGLGIGRMFGVYAVTALLIGVICAVSLGLSALVSRTTTSSVLSYLTVFSLTVGTGLLFLLLAQVAGEEVSYGEGSTYTYTQARPDRVWWIIAPNPFVVLADAAPATPTTTEFRPDGTAFETREPSDLLGAMRAGIRQFRVSPDEAQEFSEFSEFSESTESTEGLDGPPVWPFGLGFQLFLAAGALVATQRRLRTPTGTLPTGQRVA